MTDKRGRGRPPGSRNKRPPGIRDTAEFREKLLGSLTEKQIASLPAELKARLASTLVPKERGPVSDAPSVRLVISGLPGRCPACGALVPPDGWESPKVGEGEAPVQGASGSVPPWNPADPDAPRGVKGREECPDLPRRGRQAESPAKEPPPEAPPPPSGPRMMIRNGEPVLVDAAGREIKEEDEFKPEILTEF